MEVEVRQLSHGDGIFKQLPTAGQSFPIKLSGKNNICRNCCRKAKLQLSQKMETPKNVADKGKGAETHFGFKAGLFRFLGILPSTIWFVGHIE